MLDINIGPFPELRSERLRLRNLQESDAETILRFRSDAELIRYFDANPMQSTEEAMELIRKSWKLHTDNAGLQWALELADTGEMIGMMSIWRIDKANHRGEIGYLLAREYQGKGLMSEALQAMFNYGFETLRLHSLEANVNTENQASMNILLRNGFTRDAYFRENFYFNGKFLDSVIFSLITPL